MKIKIFILAFIVLLFAPLAPARERAVKLWGSQSRFAFTLGVTADGNRVELERDAKIVRIDSTAHSYCIWSEGKPAFCGGDKNDLVGTVLDKGAYTVFPDLEKDQRKVKTTITLEYVEEE